MSRIRRVSTAIYIFPKPEDGEEEIEDEDEIKLDPHLRETLQILHDYIKLLDPNKQIAARNVVNDALGDNER